MEKVTLLMAFLGLVALYGIGIHVGDAVGLLEEVRDLLSEPEVEEFSVDLGESTEAENAGS